MSLWFRVWSTPNNSDIRFEKADTFDVDGYVIARNVDTSAIFLVGQLLGSNLGNISYADGVSVTDTGSFNAKWTQLTMTSPPTSVVWTLAIAADWQSFITSISANLTDFLYIINGSSVAFFTIVDGDVKYYTVDHKVITQNELWYSGTDYLIRDVCFTNQWNITDELYNDDLSFTLETSGTASFKLRQRNGALLNLGRAVSAPKDIDPSGSNIPPNDNELNQILEFPTNMPISHDCLFVQIQMTGDSGESTAQGISSIFAGKTAYYILDFTPMTSNLASVGMQFVSLSLRAKTAFLEKFPKYKKMCCAGPMEPNLQLLLCDQFTVDGGPGNNANCNDFMSTTWCATGGTGTHENAPECACYGPITDEIDNDIYTAMAGSRPRRCVVGACQRGYIPSDSLDHQCTPLCVQVAKLTADCDGMIKYNVQQLMDCGN